jgi:radical SAM superfamily enzyme YgiQ (UPF0313 family)
MKIVLMIAIAGTDINFLLSMPTLKAYLNQFEDVKKEYEFIILDYKYSIKIDKIIEDIKSIKFDILALSCYIWNKERIEILMHSKLCDNIIIGGPDIPKDVSPKDNTYKITPVYGAGEHDFYKFLMNKEPPLQRFDEYPSPYLTNSINYNTIHDTSLYMTMETSKGCTNKCTYCSYNKISDKIIYRNPDTVIKEIAYIYSILGYKGPNIVDSNFFVNEKRAIYILEQLLEKKLIMRICMGIIIHFLTPKIIDICKKYQDAGGELLFGIGIQSTNNTVLREVKRPLINESLFLKQLGSLLDTGVMVGLDLIIALPKDTKKNYYDSVEFLCKLMRYERAYPNCNILHIIPGTTIHERLKEYNYKLDEFDRVISSPTISHKEIIDCMLISLVVRRLFDPNDIDNYRKQVRQMFFQKKDELNITAIELIEKILFYIKRDLFDENFGQDFKDQRMHQIDMRKQIPYEWLLKTMEKM